VSRSLFPLKLDLPPGLRWRGKLTVTARAVDGYAVEFNAESPKADPQERYVYDRAVLTAKQLKDWTGWSE
jgi:hypothetical protein